MTRTYYRIDRAFQGVGRITACYRSEGERNKRDAFVTWLVDTGRRDVLKAIAGGRLALDEAYSAHGAGRLDFTPRSAVLQRPLTEAKEAWLPMSAAAPATRARYGKGFAFLARLDVLRADATIADLEFADWRRAYNQVGQMHPVAWNRMRSAVSRFLSMTLGGKFDPFRLKVINPDTFPRAKEAEGRVPDLSPDVFAAILAKVPEALRPCYVTLAVTGLRPGEYVRCEATSLLEHTHALQVPGTKTAASAATIRIDEELWPWVTAAIPCPVSQDALYRTWKAACVAAEHAELVLYDLRHFYGQQLADAGEPEARIQVGLRHATASMTRRYTKQRDRGATAKTMAQVLGPPLKLVAGV